MDITSSENASSQALKGFKADKNNLTTLKSNSTNSTDQHNPLNSNLTNLSKLSQIAESSSMNIREDAIKRAHTLLNDPNWLCDKNLDSLASKITHIENF
jgi:hypothetical protein